MKLNEEFELVKVEKKKKGEQIDATKCEPFKLEPWHLSTVATILDVIILVIYMYAPLTRIPLLIIGYGGIILAITSIVLSYKSLYYPKAPLSMQVKRFTGMINIVACFVTFAVALLTLMLT